MIVRRASGHDRFFAWSAGSSAWRTSTASPARSAASAGSARTRWPATCSGGSCPGAGAATCSWPTAPGSTSTSAPTPSTPRPECDSILDLVTHDKAGERILEQLLGSAEQRLREEGIRGVIYLFKNNTDSAGNSYGCHENYLTSRRDDFGHYAEVLIPFFVSRQIYAGAGKVLQTARGRDVLHRPAGRAHLGGRVLGHHPEPPDHQHARRAPRRRRALPPPARDRGRLEHERVRHLPQGRGHLDPPAHARGPEPGPAGPHAREPDPGHPRDQPRHHAAGARCAWPTGGSCRPSTSSPSTSTRRSSTPRPRASARWRSRRSACGSTASPRSSAIRWTSTASATGSSSTS